jgi:MYXO-CTERM domain-containing protein
MGMVIGWILSSSIAGVGAGSAIDEVDADRTRIQRHLAEVERDLRAVDTSAMTAELRAERARNLDRLHDYWTAGVFPRNADFVGQRVPYFIDAEDRACAVGHLMIESGASELAASIRHGENNAKLLEMQTPGIAGWVGGSGLSAQEHARIQPSYCNCPEDEAPVCGSDGHTYLNECYATTCAGVEVAHEGVCEGEQTTGWPEPGTSTDPGTSTGATTSTSAGSTDTNDDDDDAPADKGCNVAAGSGGWLGLAIVVLARVRRTRRR